MSNRTSMPRIATFERLFGLRRFIKRPYDNSVIRRTAILLALVIPAFAANMLVNYGAAALLAPDQFGIFYVANTISNVLFSGSLVFNMLFTRYLVSIQLQHGKQATFVGLARLQQAVVRWGALGASAAFTLLWLFGHRVGMQSNIIVLLVVLDVYSSYVADLGRILLQSLRLTVPLGLYTLIWMLLRLILCMLGIILFRAVWGAFVGIVASGVIVALILHVWATKQRVHLRADVPRVPSLMAMWPVIIGYGLTITLSNVDVLMSYFLLDGINLGIYSASSVFPKAIIVVIMPLLQMLFPIAMGSHLSGRESRIILAKCGVVIIAISLCATMATWFLSGQLCGGVWGINGCQISTLNLLLWSVTPLVLLRAFVLFQFARGLDWLPISIAIPISAYLYVIWQSAPASSLTIAKEFAILSFGSLAILSVIHGIAEFFGSRRVVAS